MGTLEQRYGHIMEIRRQLEIERQTGRESKREKDTEGMTDKKKQTLLWSYGVISPVKRKDRKTIGHRTT